MNPQQAQLAPHRAERIDLPGMDGNIAALHLAVPEPVATVLLLPGYTGSKEDFAPLLDPLGDAGFELFAIDLPGQYESTGPDDEDEYRPEILGERITALVQRLAAEGRRMFLLGHSYGGLVARGALLGGCPAAGLVLLDSGPGAVTDNERAAVLGEGTGVLRDDGVQAAWQIRATALEQNPWYHTLPERLRTLHRERFVRSNPAGLIGMADVLRNADDSVAPVARVLAARGIPCLVVCGENDDAWAVTVQQRMADRLDADFAVLPDCGHSPNTENPKALLSTLLPTWHTWLE